MLKELEKQLFNTCKQTDFGNIHFDIKQIQFVVWADERDLTLKLKDQINKSGLGV